MGEPVVVSATRTPIGKFGGLLKTVTTTELGAIVVQEALTRAETPPGEVDEVIMGNVLTAGLGQNPARQSAVYAEVPPDVGAVTVNKVCGSGLKAVMLAAQSVRAGDQEVLVAGGMENMSRAPYLLPDARWGKKYGDSEVIDSMIHDGLWDAFNDFHMLKTGEIVADRHGISREEADEFALESHRKASGAITEGLFDDEIVGVEVAVDGRRETVREDEGVRHDTSLEKLSGLEPVLRDGEVITAGNASQLSDGASAVVVMDSDEAEELGVEPMLRIVDYNTGGVEPRHVMEAPIPTVRKLLEKTGLSIEEMDVVEHNEAYATASIVVRDELGIPEEKFNPRGGAVALGHPIGCSGARILTTLAYEMEDMKRDRGLVTLCLGGGNAVAAIVERYT